MPLVSVIMPYYKKINFVINAINSVLKQSFQNFLDLHIFFLHSNPQHEQGNVRRLKSGSKSILNVDIFIIIISLVQMKVQNP